MPLGAMGECFSRLAEKRGWLQTPLRNRSRIKAGSVRCKKFNGIFIVLSGTVLFCDYTIEFSPDAIGEWYFDTVITIGSVMLYSIIGDRSGIVSSIITYVDDLKRISEIGRVRYFINSEGRIEYEKVPNGSWTFALAMYSS